jgi:rod shape determining protein RodA
MASGRRGPDARAGTGDQVRVRRKLDSLDLPLIGATLALALLGAVAVASATVEGPGTERLWRTQLIWLLISLVGAAVVAAVDYRLWAGTALFLHAGVILLLVLVLVIGHEVGGHRSWLDFGPLRLQPAEIAKWTTCLVLAFLLTRRVGESIGLRQLIEIGLLAGIPAMLIALQPDMGTAVIFVPIFLGALLMGGVRWKVILVVVLVGLLLAPAFWFLLEDYQKERILTVLDPGRDPAGYGYQVRQSKIAIGSGGLAGKGLFQGTQSQLNFLPAQHTDFVLSVLAEELGFLGVLAVLGLFYVVFYRGIVAALSAQDRLGTYICMLVVAWIAGQMAVNVDMAVGRLPTIGVPLPLVSYGGSSLVSTLAGIALILNVRSRRFVN